MIPTGSLAPHHLINSDSKHRGKPGHAREGNTVESHKTQPRRPTDSRAKPGHAPVTTRSGRPSEEAAPCEPNPAPSRSQSTSPRLLEGGRRDEGTRCGRVAAGGAGVRPEPRPMRSRQLETREAEAGGRYGPAAKVADQRAQRRDH